MWSRKPGLPADVKASMTLVRGEKVLAAAADSAGDWIIGTARALHLGGGDAWTVLPWHVGGERRAPGGDSAGEWISGTARALHLGEGDAWTVLPWQRVERAGWDRDAE